MPVKGLNLVFDDAENYLKVERTKLVKVAKDATRKLVEELMARTPVWQGTTLRNFQVGIDAPSTLELTAEGAGDPGPTNSMPIGAEPRRPENEDAVRSDMESELESFDELGHTIIVSNTSENWDLVDNGSAPTPDRARNPGGVSLLAIQATKAAMRGQLK